MSGDIPGALAARATHIDRAGIQRSVVAPERIHEVGAGIVQGNLGGDVAGTEVTLFGSIPPVADGSGPMSLVPWGVAAVALLGLVLWMRRRHAALDEPDAPGAPDALDAPDALPA
jgi:MYXO-CTERM domain-containing protein